MKPISDLQVNKADDIILFGNDLKLEPNNLLSVMRNAQRRLSAREDDFFNNYTICAGLEQFRQQKTRTELIRFKIQNTFLNE